MSPRTTLTRPPVAGTDRPGSRRGAYAGPVTRATSLSIDALLISAAVSIGLYVVRTIVDLLFPDRMNGALPAALITLGAFIIFQLYSAIAMWAFGKTVGMFVLGIRLVRTDGTRVSGTRALLRALVFPWSGFLLLGYLWIFVGRRRRMWHDIVAGTVVVYDWDAVAADPLRPAELRPH